MPVTDLWTWGGAFFGHRDGNELWSHDGRHVGRCDGDDIYGPSGRYLGEIRNPDRLITAKSKLGRRRGSFRPWASRAGQVPHASHVGYVMSAGYQDFPAPDEPAG